MKKEESISRTFQRIDDDIDFEGAYHDIVLLMSTATACIYRLSKAGKTMLLKSPIDDSGRSLDLLKREYRMAVGLSHPNIAAVYTWETSTPVGPGILMEFVDGLTLGAYLNVNPPLKIRKRLFGQLLDAVGYIHKHGLIHNDLKPANIMVSRANDDVKIIDFGLSDIDGERVQRQLGGTRGYASPELMTRSPQADTRSDIYSLGVIMRDMFGSKYRHIWQKCIQADAARRYRNIDEVINVWRRCQRYPYFITGLCLAVGMALVIVLGASEISGLRRNLVSYNDAARNMADTISMLRESQIASNDSISCLNGQLYHLNREKALADSLANVYTVSVGTITDRYIDRFKNMRCNDECIYLYKSYDIALDYNDSTFIAANGVAGEKIVEQYSQSLRMKHLRALEDIARQKPSLANLTSDLDEQMRLIPLIHAGKPWSLKTDIDSITH